MKILAYSLVVGLQFIAVKITFLSILRLMSFSLIILFSSCFYRQDKVIASTEENEGFILGFSQIGAESSWRNKNSLSIQNAAAQAQVQLLFENAEQKQENQIKAIRSFIVYQVDVIAFVPIVADGWDNILKEAADAGIPVLLTDRKINTPNEYLYAGFIGSDSLKEGQDAAEFLIRKFETQNYSISEPVKIIEISGTEGSSPAIGRAEGFRNGLKDHPEYQIIKSISGDFLRSKGLEIMRKILRENDDIDVVYSHNDGMTLGVIDAIKEFGLEPGKDIILISIDAEQAAIDALKRGEINCIVECNPYTGPAILELSAKLARGEKIPRLQHVREQVFTEFDDLSTIEPRGY